MSVIKYEVGKLAFEDHDYAKALRYLRPLASQGHPKAQHLLGFMYAEGLGVPPNGTVASSMFREAAARGLKEARVELAALCDYCKEMSCDQVDIVEWLRHAADRGVKEAQVALGFKYARGQNIPRDDEMAFRWFRRAADGGSSEASAALGFMYADGRGVGHRDVEAVKRFRAAADRGLKIAQAALGFMYSGGRGVPQDYVQAYMWISVSEIEDNGDVRDQLDSIATKMSSEQVAEAKRLADGWKPRQP